MRKISLNNAEVKKILYNFSDELLSGKYDYILDDESAYKSYRDPKEYTVTEEYLQKQRDIKRGHVGYPESLKGIELRHNVPESEVFSKNDASIKDHLLEILKLSGNTTSKLNQYIVSKRNALCAYYPKDGYIGWHNNQNAPGHNVLFSYSETGTGWFEWLDLEKDEHVVMQDEKGVWTCKVGYYGRYEEGNKVCWHKAESNGGRRITVAFMCPDENMWKMAIEDIETP
jgi:hypothetical protein